MDEDRLTPPADPLRPGLDVSRLSVAEIEAHIAALHREIARLEAALAAKRQSQQAADAVFKL